MPRGSYMQFDETTSNLSDNAFRVLCYLRHHTMKSNTVYPSIESMSEDLSRSTRTCKRAIAELKEANMITVQQGLHGVWEYTVRRSGDEPKKVTNLSPRGDKNGIASVTKMSPQGDAHSDTHSDTHSDKFVIPPKNPLICEVTEVTEVIEGGSSGGISEESKPVRKSTTTTGAEIEPFESGLPATLPNVRNGIAPFRNRTVEIVPTKLKPETVAAICEVLGTDGDQFARKITQEQADAGFPDWILAESRNNKTPVKLAFHLLKTAWRDGWTDPQEAENALLEEMADMIRSLK